MEFRFTRMRARLSWDDTNRMDLHQEALISYNLIQKRGVAMKPKALEDKLSIYIPQAKMEQRPVARLIKLGKKRDRSVNYLVVEAILQYLDREEA